MRLLITLFRIGLFLLALWFALKNTGLVSITFLTSETTTEMPLIVVMLLCFGLGTLFGLLAMLPGMFQRRREVSALKRQLAQLSNPQSAHLNADMINRNANEVFDVPEV